MAFFDHVYGVVDADTADEIARCDFLHRFTRFVVGTTVSDGETWTGRYLFGRRTYVELFGPTDLEGPEGAEGSTGLGLSTHDRGAIEILAGRMKDAHARVQMKRRTNQDGDQVVPWFDELSPEEPTHAFCAWVMEFLGDPTDLQLRESEFDAWAQQSEASAPQGRGPLLGDVASVELDATVEDVAVAGPLLRAAGFVVTRTADGLSADDTLTTITLRCTTPDAVGLRRIEFQLAAPAVAAHVEVIGRSMLAVGPDSLAVWEFTGR